MMCRRYIDDIFTMRRWCIDDDSDDGGEVMREVRLEPTRASYEALARATSDTTTRRTRELLSRFMMPSQTFLVPLPWLINSSSFCELEAMYIMRRAKD